MGTFRPSILDESPTTRGLRCTRSGKHPSRPCRQSWPSHSSASSECQLASAPANAVSPQWQTTATFNPLANVNAVSCAPSATASSATCVAVGDDGGQVASIIVTDDGGAAWTDAAPPSGVTGLSTVSCPSAAVCYAGGGSGLLKSSNGGTTWTVLDSSFTAQSMSCVTIDPVHCRRREQYRRDRRRVYMDASDSTSFDQHPLERCRVRTPPPAWQQDCVNGNPCSRWDYKWEHLDERSPIPQSIQSLRCLARPPQLVWQSVWPRQVGQPRSATTNFSTWQSTSSIPSGTELESIACPIETTCVAVGSNLSSSPFVIGTSNSGSTWTSQNPPANAVHLTGISCSAAEDCIAVGDNGDTGAGSTIMSTTRWRISPGHPQVPPAGTSQLNSVSCPTTSDCFAVGVNAVLASVNEGYAWTAQSIPPQRSMASTRFRVQPLRTALRSDSAYFAIRSSSEPLDAGATWTTRTSSVRYRHSNGGLVQQYHCLSCRQRLRDLIAEHPRDRQWWRHLDAGRASRNHQ